MRQQIADKKLIGMGGAVRAVGRDTTTCREYVRAMFAEGVPGVYRTDGGQYILTNEALAELKTRTQREWGTRHRLPGA